MISPQRDELSSEDLAKDNDRKLTPTTKGVYHSGAPGCIMMKHEKRIRLQLFDTKLRSTAVIP